MNQRPSIHPDDKVALRMIKKINHTNTLLTFPQKKKMGKNQLNNTIVGITD